MSCIIRIPETALSWNLESAIFNYIVSTRYIGGVDNYFKFALLNNDYNFDEVKVVNNIIELNIDKVNNKHNKNLFFKFLIRNNINFDLVVDGDRIINKVRGNIEDKNLTLEEIYERNSKYNISLDIVKKVTKKNIMIMDFLTNKYRQTFRNEFVNIQFTKKVLLKCSNFIYYDDFNHSNIIIDPIQQQEDNDSNLMIIGNCSKYEKYTEKDLQNTIKYFGIDKMYYFCNRKNEKIESEEFLCYNGFKMDVLGSNFTKERLLNTIY